MQHKLLIVLIVYYLVYAQVIFTQENFTDHIYSYITGRAPGSARLTLTGRIRKGGMNALKASQGTVRETFLAK